MHSNLIFSVQFNFWLPPKLQWSLSGQPSKIAPKTSKFNLNFFGMMGSIFLCWMTFLGAILRQEPPDELVDPFWIKKVLCRVRLIFEARIFKFWIFTLGPTLTAQNLGCQWHDYTCFFSRISSFHWIYVLTTIKCEVTFFSIRRKFWMPPNFSASSLMNIIIFTLGKIPTAQNFGCQWQFIHGFSVEHGLFTIFTYWSP